MVDAVIERLGRVIEQRVRDEVCVVLNSRREAEALLSKLKTIQKVLDDAELKSVKDDKVEAWLESLRELAYEMDDALDEWEMKSHRQPELMEEESDRDFWEKVSSFIQSLCSCFKDVIERRNIAWKIKKLNEELKSIAKKKEEEFNFVPNISRSDSQPFERVRETSDIEITKVHGQEYVKNSLVNKLLSYGSHDLEIVSVVGVGGLGKTTLAKLAYNDTKVKEHFNTKIWISVSDPFDEIRIAKAIIESVERDSPNLTEFQSLLERIKTCVKGKKFLLVLDDVWCEDEKKWEPLKMSLSEGQPGSKILVTTRKDGVVKMMGATKFQGLDPLSHSDCWSLLSQIAFQWEPKEDPDRQEKIGKKIAEKCQGLPLAAVTLGSLLRKKVTVQEWEKVFKSEIWELEDVEGELFRHLYLSYNELSRPVKRCFSYCAIFPKGSTIFVDELINMWMSQGFLSSGSAEDMELTGRKYVKVLVASSFFTQTFEVGGKIHLCKIHDIVHDFAQSLTKNECYIFDERVPINASLVKARHINWLGTRDSSMCNVEKLRSFVCKGNPPPSVLSSLKCVRLLWIGECDLEELPTDIGNLIHLRNLRLCKRGDIRRLPRSLCDLYYLQTLDVSMCRKLKELPEEMYKLKNLRHLLVTKNVILPQGVGELTDLRTLNNFRAERGGSKLGYLKNINQLEGELRITVIDLNEELDGIEAQNAQLEKKTSLQFLHLSFNGETRMDVIEALRPPPNLLHLVVWGLCQYPQWMGSLNKLKALYICGCSTLPSLLWNMQWLEELHISGARSMKCLRTNELLGITDLIVQQTQSSTQIEGERSAFPQLKMLEFIDCDGWIEWEDIAEDEENVVSITIMPCLQELKLRGCPRLKSLPSRFLRKIPQLECLDISDSSLLVEQYESRGRFEFLSPTCRVEHYELDISHLS